MLKHNLKTQIISGLIAAQGIVGGALAQTSSTQEQDNLSIDQHGKASNGALVIQAKFLREWSPEGMRCECKYADLDLSLAERAKIKALYDKEDRKPEGQRQKLKIIFDINGSAPNTDIPDVGLGFTEGWKIIGRVLPESGRLKDPISVDLSNTGIDEAKIKKAGAIAVHFFP